MDDLDATLIDPRSLPPQQRRLFAVLGPADFVALVGVRGGVPIYPPDRVPDQPTVDWQRAISRDGLQRLVDACRTAQPGELGANGEIVVPVASRLIQQVQRARVRAAMAETPRPSATTIARRFGLRRETVFRLLREIEADRQFEMPV